MKKKKAGVNKLLKMAAGVGLIASAAGVVLAWLGGVLAFKLLRYMDTAQRVLPTLEQASLAYLEQNAPQRLRVKQKK